MLSRLLLFYYLLCISLAEHVDYSGSVLQVRADRKRPADHREPQEPPPKRLSSTTQRSRSPVRREGARPPRTSIAASQNRQTLPGDAGPPAGRRSPSPQTSSSQEPPLPMENYRTYSSSSSDGDIRHASLKATVRGPGKLTMLPSEPISVHENQKVSQKVRDHRVKAKLDVQEVDTQSTLSETLAKGEKVKTTVDTRGMKTGGSIYGSGIDGSFSKRVRPNRKVTMRAQASLDAEGEPDPRARILATIDEGGKIRAKASRIGDQSSGSDTDASSSPKPER